MFVRYTYYYRCLLEYNYAQIYVIGFAKIYHLLHTTSIYFTMLELKLLVNNAVYLPSITRIIAEIHMVDPGLSAIP